VTSDEDEYERAEREAIQAEADDLFAFPEDP
jgi:hypothetical protein